MKAFNIEWNVEFDNDIDALPNEMYIPDDIEDMDEIADFISNATGYCHYCFELTDIPKNNNVLFWL